MHRLALGAFCTVNEEGPTPTVGQVLMRRLALGAFWRVRPLRVSRVSSRS